MVYSAFTIAISFFMAT